MKALAIGSIVLVSFGAGAVAWGEEAGGTAVSAPRAWSGAVPSLGDVNSLLEQLVAVPGLYPEPTYKLYFQGLDAFVPEVPVPVGSGRYEAKEVHACLMNGGRHKHAPVLAVPMAFVEESDERRNNPDYVIGSGLSSLGVWKLSGRVRVLPNGQEPDRKLTLDPAGFGDMAKAVGGKTTQHKYAHPRAAAGWVSLGTGDLSSWGYAREYKVAAYDDYGKERPDTDHQNIADGAVWTLKDPTQPRIEISTTKWRNREIVLRPNPLTPGFKLVAAYIGNLPLPKPHIHDHDGVEHFLEFYEMTGGLTAEKWILYPVKKQEPRSGRRIFCPVTIISPEP